MSELKIESNITIPHKEDGHGLSAVLRQMQVGDSVLVPVDDEIRHPAHIAYLVLGKGNFVTRKENGGLRIWRTKLGTPGIRGKL